MKATRTVLGIPFRMGRLDGDRRPRRHGPSDASTVDARWPRDPTLTQNEISDIDEDRPRPTE
jgi:hypothetical protein